MASVGSDPIGIKHTGAQEYAQFLPLAAISQHITVLEWHACFSAGECSFSSLKPSGMISHYAYEKLSSIMDTQK